MLPKNAQTFDFDFVEYLKRLVVILLYFNQKTAVISLSGD